MVSLCAVSLVLTGVEAFCGPSFDLANTCTVFNGIMTVSLREQADIDFVKYRVRDETRAFLSTAVFAGLAGARYLAPEIVSPTEVSKGNEFDSETPVATARSDLSPRTIVLFSVAAGAFVVTVGVALYFRRLYIHKRREESSQGDESSTPELTRIDTGEACSVDVEEPLSPFSEMLPKAYRLDDGSDMSIILEMPEDASVGQSSGILVSEGWSTDDETLDSSAVVNTSRLSEVPVLGARRRKVRNGWLCNLLATFGYGNANDCAQAEENKNDDSLLNDKGLLNTSSQGFSNDSSVDDSVLLHRVGDDSILDSILDDELLMPPVDKPLDPPAPLGVQGRPPLFGRKSSNRSFSKGFETGGVRYAALDDSGSDSFSLHADGVASDSMMQGNQEDDSESVPDERFLNSLNGGLVSDDSDRDNYDSAEDDDTFGAEV